MSATYFIPFNHQPDSVVRATTSTVIASGKYTRIIPLCGDINLNGVFLGEQIATYGSEAVNNRTENRQDVILAKGGWLTINLSSSGDSTSFSGTYNFQKYDSTNTLTDIVSVSPNWNGFTLRVDHFNANYDAFRISATESGSGDFTITEHNIYCYSGEPFWVKAGDTVDGNNFLIEYYNEIS